MSLDNDLECGADVHRLVDSLKFPELQACLHVNCGKFSLSLLNRSMFFPRSRRPWEEAAWDRWRCKNLWKHMGKSFFKSRKNWKKNWPIPTSDGKPDCKSLPITIRSLSWQLSRSTIFENSLLRLYRIALRTRVWVWRYTPEELFQD